jgi:hypothetical protein
MDEETALLLGFLDGERQHVMGILEGCSEEQLRRPGTSTRPPSCWTGSASTSWASWRAAPRSSCGGRAPRRGRRVAGRPPVDRDGRGLILGPRTACRGSGLAEQVVELGLDVDVVAFLTGRDDLVGPVEEGRHGLGRRLEVRLTERG